ncbi:hypothetical protein D3C75_1303610 [compost metagenome]
MDDGLGRNAADVQAGTAEAVAAVHQNGVQPELAASDARDIAAGSGADDQDFGFEGLGHSSVSIEIGWLLPLANRS